MFDLHRLRLLRELKHRGTLAAVAAALSYSPSSVSQQLSLLETEVGVPLLEPVGRRVRLTEQAEILVAHTEAVLERLERAEADIASSLTELTGALRVACFQTASLTLVITALTLLRDTHPRLRVHVTQVEPEIALPALLARDHDLVITEEYPGDPHPRVAELDVEQLCEDPLRLAQPRGTRVARSGKGAVGPTEALRALAGHPWVLEPEGSAARRWAISLCRQVGFEPDVRFESSDLLLHRRLVERGLAVALLPDLVWEGRRPTVPLRRLPRGHQARRLLTVVRAGRGGHPAIRACRAALREAAGTLS
ncbi:DNA-binding transcriptional regulator, LysR family [Streptoalloteichus tenebrarius]|uniref:DNA-binding transcriptional regulator, LysR family n=1 Tax=Streptoalloteichus tenebrarius (strain ATCC 17920 / DSM 40477 / JCM 4838 / CBS 697.72 / NBRC 16177 / NCIMB 11028 / NRRL B-12390 / A12253. 1 / ISP 5477) TaxID=1933 RepID=A0ABT1HLS7_STRSD|nr:LysR substrate-binding domain-containing protein [Streptoalloteichus tenebrarius]MCP2256469.1 DNA-binding transcriptional regulator, LysR family [Streptoalloteichus tenebrarius]BFF04820.1 LysR substrate-binding domain-containing protein [Streptoalloteichus tenebrarius]